MPTNSLRVADVFVPGGLPKHTYVPRSSRGLEERLSEVTVNLCKIATVTGATKSGKTVLVKKVLGTSDHVWVDGGHVSDEEQFWQMVAAQLSTPSEVENTVTTQQSSEIGADISAEAGVLIARGVAKASGKTGRAKAESAKNKFTTFTPWEVTRQLKSRRIPLVIDDFHYLPRTLQGSLTRVLKPLVFEGLPVIYLAIPHRRYDAIKVEREMNGRIEAIEVPSWEIAELAQIAQLGFPLLQVTPNANTSTRLAAETQGSPHLMQEFCRNICYLSGFRGVPDKQRVINPNFDYAQIFRGVAKELGKSIYDKLARGPRNRTDRIPRRLKDGRTTDIYKVVLLALSHLKPDVSTLEYEEIRSALKAVLDDNLPQAHEISRVLEQMAKVSSSDESSVPVIDYEKDDRKLHITDPFFAFFLKWGSEMVLA